jgi:hypothetical protein
MIFRQIHVLCQWKIFKNAYADLNLPRIKNAADINLFLFHIPKLVHAQSNINFASLLSPPLMSKPFLAILGPCFQLPFWIPANIKV